MQPFKPKRPTSKGPEAELQDGLVLKLRSYEWYVKVMIGNMYQFGVPDVFAAHQRHGMRWIEVKNPVSFSFTPAQLIEFPKMHAAGVGIWILFGPQESEILKLFKPANWFEVYHNWLTNANGKR